MHTRRIAYSDAVRDWGGPTEAREHQGLSANPRRQKRGIDQLSQMSTLREYKMRLSCFLSHPPALENEHMCELSPVVWYGLLHTYSNFLLFTLKIAGPSSIYEQRLMFAWAQPAWPKTSSKPSLLTLTMHFFFTRYYFVDISNNNKKVKNKAKTGAAIRRCPHRIIDWFLKELVLNRFLINSMVF